MRRSSSKLILSRRSCRFCASRINGAEYDACVDRGVKYFRDIGSYPRLKAYPEAGRLAEDVARERCRRTLTAFGK